MPALAGFAAALPRGRRRLPLGQADERRRPADHRRHEARDRGRHHGAAVASALARGLGVRAAHALARGEHLEHGLGRDGHHRRLPGPVLGRSLLGRRLLGRSLLGRRGGLLDRHWRGAGLVLRLLLLDLPAVSVPRFHLGRAAIAGRDLRHLDALGLALALALDRSPTAPPRATRSRPAAPGAPRRGPPRAAPRARRPGSRSRQRDGAPPPACPRRTRARERRRARVFAATGRAAPSLSDPDARGRRRAVRVGSRDDCLAY